MVFNETAISQKPEIIFTPPQDSPSWAGLNRMLVGLEQDLPGISEGDILTKQQCMLAMIFLLTDPNLQAFYLKAMHLEFPTDKQRAGYTFNDPIFLIDFLYRGIAHAIAGQAEGQVVLDVFTAQFERDHFNFRNTSPEEAMQSNVNRIARSNLHMDSLKRNFRYDVVSHGNRKLRPVRAIKGLMQLNVHAVADAIPQLPLNIFRSHDHRKGAFFDFSDKPSVFLLQTFNYDRPLDIDCAVVLRDPEILEMIRTLFAQEIPQNAIIEGENWKIYQDGTSDLDPASPIKSSPILSRLREIILNPETQTLVWCSQFLPDFDDLKILEQRLIAGSIESIDVFCPHPSMWSSFYRLSGGNKSKNFAEKLARQYSGKFFLHYSTDRYIHTKLLFINDRILLLGSHNFNTSLVKSRTSEICFECEPNERMNQSLVQIFGELLTSTQSYSLDKRS